MAKQLVYSGRIIFDHLAKTGGMAVMAWLRDVLGSGAVGPSITEDHLSLINRYGGIYSIIGAHIYFQGEGLDPRYQYFTVLRDPIDRVISQLYYAANTVPKTKEFLEDIRAAEAFLESEGSIVSQKLLKSISNYYVDHFFNIDNDPAIEISDSQRLSSALEALNNFDTVGIFENMPIFLSNIADLVGIPKPSSIALVNQTNKRPVVSDVSPVLRARISALNQLDIQLYQQVKAWKEAAQRPPIKAVLRVPVLPYTNYESIAHKVRTTPDIVLVNVELREGYDICHGGNMTFLVDFRSTRAISNFQVGISIQDEARRLAFGTNSALLKQVYSPLAGGSYRVIFQLLAELPAGKYIAGFAFEELSGSKVLELGRHYNLVEFYVYYPSKFAGTGFANLPSVITLLPFDLPSDKCVVTRPIGQLILKSPLHEIQAKEQVMVEVQILNGSMKSWGGDQFFPINLSYHWIDNVGNTVIYDGVRTALSIDGVRTGQTVDATMKVIAPVEPGVYTLFLTIVQENVGWFDELGDGFVGTLKKVRIDQSS